MLTILNALLPFFNMRPATRAALAVPGTNGSSGGTQGWRQERGGTSDERETVSTLGCEAASYPLFIGEPARLAVKLEGAGGLLEEAWAGFRKRLHESPEARAQMVFLPALLTGESADFAREQLRDYWRLLATHDTAGDFQFHTWCRCGAVMRRAAFFDWLAELGTTVPNVRRLFEGLSSPHWPVQTAAAEAVGRRGVREAIPAIRCLLEAEHARPAEELYPPQGAEAEGRSTEDLGKRWRLKAALIVALGRLRDAEAVPLLGRILADGRDFYTVYSVAAQALGRIGGPEALAALGPAFKENEVDTRARALAAREAIERHGGQ